jgi:hypothetical protein
MLILVLPLDLDLPLDPALDPALGSVRVLVLVPLCVWPSLAVCQGAVRVGACPLSLCCPLCSSSLIEPSQGDGQTRGAARVLYLDLTLVLVLALDLVWVCFLRLR